MNFYTQHLVGAVEEIRVFASSDEGSKFDAQWYSQIGSLVSKACSQASDEEAECYLDMVMRSIVDSGPLGLGFAPSIHRAVDAMQRKRKRALNKKRSS